MTGKKSYSVDEILIVTVYIISGKKIAIRSSKITKGKGYRVTVVDMKVAEISGTVRKYNTFVFNLINSVLSVMVKDIKTILVVENPSNNSAANLNIIQTINGYFLRDDNVVLVNVTPTEKNNNENVSRKKKSADIQYQEMALEYSAAIKDHNWIDVLKNDYDLCRATCIEKHILHKILQR